MASKLHWGTVIHVAERAVIETDDMIVYGVPYTREPTKGQNVWLLESDDEKYLALVNLRGSCG